jgi:alpha-1,6-mannosyltransferase
VKVLDITDFYSERGGGIRSHLVAKGVALARAGIEHVVIAPGPADSEIFVGSEARGRARVLRVRGWPQPYDANYRFLNRLSHVRALIRRERPDVIEINSPYLAALAALSVPKNDTRVTTWLWHSDHIDTHLTPRIGRRWGERGAALATRPLWSLLAAIARRCDATLVASQCESKKLERHGFPHVVRVPLGVDKGVFTPLARSEARRRELLGGHPPSSALLIGIGRLSVEKHWEVVLDAFARVRAERPAVLVLFGDGPERVRLAALARGRDDIRLLQFEPNRRRLAEALASADVLVHACPYETFGLGVAEAVSVGLPIVVPDEGGASEHARGACAERYSAGSAEDCAAAVLRLLSRDHALVRRAAREAAQGVIDVRQQFMATIELYQELLESSAGLRSRKQ